MYNFFKKVMKLALPVTFSAVILVSALFYSDVVQLLESKDSNFDDGIENRLVLVNEERDFREASELLSKIESDFKFVQRYSRIGSKYSIVSLKAANEISKGTPLDLESSLVLIKYSEKFDLKPSLILAVIDLESNFNRYEVGGADDRGLMQIIPSTEKWLARDVAKVDYDPNKIFNSEYNIGLATSYLSFLNKAYGNDFHRILSEYNRGPYNLAKYYQTNGTYSTSYSRVILKKEKKYLAYNYK
jgi:soluble lytic murein transglycosylase-like protein